MAQNYLTSDEASKLEMCLVAHGCRARVAYVRSVGASLYTRLCNALLLHVFNSPWRGSWCCLWSLTSVQGRKGAATLWVSGRVGTVVDDAGMSLVWRKNCWQCISDAGSTLIGIYIVFFNIPSHTRLLFIEEHLSLSIFAFVRVICCREMCAI